MSRCDIAEAIASVCETHPSRSEGGKIHARRGEERHRRLERARYERVWLTRMGADEL